MSTTTELTTPITAAWLWTLAGPDMWLYKWSPQGNAMLQGKSARCEMLPQEYWRYQAMRGVQVSMLEQTKDEDPLAGGQEGEVSTEDLLRILQSLRTVLGETKERIDRANGNLSIEDYGDALAGAGQRLDQSMRCVDGLQRWAAERPKTMLVHVTIKAGELTLFDDQVEAPSTSEAARQAMARPGVAKHLEDLKGKPLGILTREVKRA